MEIKHIHPVYKREEERRQRVLEIRKACTSKSIGKTKQINPLRT